MRQPIILSPEICRSLLETGCTSTSTRIIGSGWRRQDYRARRVFSTSTEAGIKEREFDHVKEVWDDFGLNALGEYNDLYLKIDVLLLADVFENFRDLCMKTYNMDATHYFTAPGLSFDAMLKLGEKCKLLDEYDMLLIFENGQYIIFIFKMCI